MEVRPTEDSGQQVEAVHAAAVASLAARGVRVYRATVREDSGGLTEPWSWELGVADLAERSVRVRSFFADDSPQMKLGDAVALRWPWLTGDEVAPERPQTGGESIEIGRRSYYGGEGGWADWSDLPLYGPRRVLWPLEAILSMTRAERLADVEVRGEQCESYFGQARPGQVAARVEAQLVDPPGPKAEWRELFAQLSIHSDGLVRRIMWSPRFGARFHGGVLARLSGSTSTDSELGRPWYVTEFWDYGCAVQISAPSDLIPRDGPSLGEIARDLWRMRRDYKRGSHPHESGLLTRPGLPSAWGLLAGVRIR